MQSQFLEKENNSEEIYRRMIEEIFDDPEVEKNYSEKNSIGAGLSNQNLQYTISKENLLSQKLINTLTAQLQSILPGAFRITTNSKQCLSCANLQNWSPGRSYYSIFEMKHTNSIWILHLSRPVGEGLAYLTYHKNAHQKNKIFIDLREADSLIYLEIGEFVRGVFKSIIELWPNSEKLEISSYRHILQLLFLNNSIQEDQYLIMPFQLDNRECSGEFHLVFPQRHLFSI